MLSPPSFHPIKGVLSNSVPSSPDPVDLVFGDMELEEGGYALPSSASQIPRAFVPWFVFRSRLRKVTSNGRIQSPRQGRRVSLQGLLRGVRLGRTGELERGTEEGKEG